MEISEEDMTRIVERAVEKIERDRAPFIIPPEKHFIDHVFLEKVQQHEEEWAEVIRYVLERKHRREDRMKDRNKLRFHILGSLTIIGLASAIGGVGVAVWQYILTIISRGH